LSSKTQTNYAYGLQFKYGPEYVWNTSNLVAFQQLQYPLKHKKIILEQWSWQKETPRHPALYMLEREISNVWTEVVVNQGNLQTRVDTAVINSNREMARKLQEFGFVDENGVVVRPFFDDTLKMLSTTLKYEGGTP